MPELRKQRVSLRNRFFVGQARKFLYGLDMAAAHEIAPHDCVSRCKGRSLPRSAKWNARLLSVIDIDDSGYTIRFQAVNLIVIEALRLSRSGIDARLASSFD